MLRILLSSIAVAVLAGCSSMYGGAQLSDESLRSDIGGVLGEEPGNITVESRRTEGANTYITARTSKGVKLACNFLGGGVLAFGMRSAPSCSQLEKSGDIKPIGSNSTSCNAMQRAAGQCK